MAKSNGKIKMKCSECKKLGKQSIVYPGIGSTTLMCCQPFYDKDGNYHHHDLNTITTPYSCSEGHEWIKSTSGSCWCGWPDITKKVGVESAGKLGIGCPPPPVELHVYAEGSVGIMPKGFQPTAKLRLEKGI